MTKPRVRNYKSETKTPALETKKQRVRNLKQPRQELSPARGKLNYALQRLQFAQQKQSLTLSEHDAEWIITFHMILIRDRIRHPL